MGIERLLLALRERGAPAAQEAFPALPLVVLREDGSAQPADLLLRDRVRERFPGHRVDLRTCRYGKLGELLARLAQVRPAHQSHSCALLQGEEERAAGTLTRRDLLQRTSEQVAFG